MTLKGKLKSRMSDARAVSPVIGVILMVAITVILAAVIGTFVLGLGQEMNKNAPTAQISFDQSAANNPGTVTISHDGGDQLKKGEVSIIFEPGDSDSLTGSSDVTNWADGSNPSDTVTAGESVDLGTDGDGFQTGDVVKVVWTSEDGGTSQVLQEYTVN
ncbi:MULTISPECIES: type IV pilin [Halorussus]|uniref:type IV pilin n=1 Tax=Halorussus TaxID=1070314 RepID=UPI00209E84EB|nr:type IV pilin N-terminal domain-containing protein [Halorussus vallis]USZ75639.1 type IV pilin N-terminal domain-containing protein [Halorussus vallis]